eukprot:8861275-Alexandrium_andersonii.AAC.1
MVREARAPPERGLPSARTVAGHRCSIDGGGTPRTAPRRPWAHERAQTPPIHQQLPGFRVPSLARVTG